MHQQGRKTMNGGPSLLSGAEVSKAVRSQMIRFGPFGHQCPNGIDHWTWRLGMAPAVPVFINSIAMIATTY